MCDRAVYNKKFVLHYSLLVILYSLVIAAGDLRSIVVAVDTDVGILLYVRTAVLEFYYSTMWAIYCVCMYIGTIIYMSHRVIDLSGVYTIDMCYGVIVGLAVVAFFAAAVGYGKCYQK